MNRSMALTLSSVGARALGCAVGLTALAGAVGVGCGGRSNFDLVEEGGAGTGAAAGHTTTTTTSHSVGGSAGTGGTGGQGAGGAQPIPALVEHDLGNVSEGQPISFEVPQGTLGMHATLDGLSNYDNVWFDSVTAPDGTPIIQNQTIPGTLAQYNWYGTICASVPQTDQPAAMPLMPGPWQFVIGTDSGPGTGHLSIWTRHTVDGLFHGGVIDINVYIVPGAASQDYMQSMLTDAFDGYAGLSAGTITFYPLDSQFATIDENNVLDAFAASKDSTGLPGLNLMVVQGFSGQLEMAAGMAAGIPGSPLEHGTFQSGIVLMIYSDTALDSMIVKHETGHYAGLYHTSEIQPGTGFDPLSDTPQCADVNAQMQNCPDYTNLMFPYAGYDQTDFSPEQLTVIHDSGLYRGIVADGWPPAPPMLPNGSQSAADNAAGLSGAVTRDSTPSAGAAHAERATTAGMHRGPAHAQPWAAGLPRGLADYLDSVWEAGLGQPDPFTIVGRLGGESRELWAVGTDGRAPAHVRMRALAAVGKLGPSAAQRRQLARLATSPNEPRLVRIGALRALVLGAAPEAHAIAESLRADPDIGVANVARASSRE